MPYPQLAAASGAGDIDLKLRLAEAVRGMGRTVHGVHQADSWRRKDVLRGRIHAAYTLELMIRGAHAAGAPIADVLPVAQAVEGFITDLYAVAAAPLADVFHDEQAAQGAADLQQFAVLAERTPSRASLAALRASLHRQRWATDRALVAVERLT